MQIVLFLILAGLALAGAINLLRESHPIYSALSLVVVMCAIAGLYLMLGAEFIAVAQIIVYAGAIMVLFLFVLMLLNAGEEVKVDRSALAMRGGFALLALLIVALVVGLKNVPPSTVNSQLLSGDNTAQIGRLLFNKYLLPFEVTSVLMLVGIIGVVVLGRRKF